MASLLDGLSEPFAALDEATASAALRELWGIEAASLIRLDTERDDTFRSGDVILKVAHPSDARELIALQSSVLEHARAADPGIPLQRVVPALDGSLTATVAGRAARVLTWLDGDLMLDGPTSPALVRASGRMLARLALALRDADDPAADRAFAWDIARLPDLRAETDDPVLLRVIDGFAAEVAPALAGLPRQVIHNDFHPGNVLVDAMAPDAVAGILDFGDVVRTARVCDLGVALAYLVPEDGSPLQPTIDTFVEGYVEVSPLLDDELALIPSLIAARQVARLVINAALARGRGESHAAPRVTAALHRILSHIERGA